MDSFETILEQLKQAQNRGKDAVTGRIDTIAEKLSLLVDEATASVRETLSREADELFPVADLRVALEEFNQRVDQEAEEKAALIGHLQEAEKRLEEAASRSSGDPGFSLELLRGLDRARSQSEILRELLPALCNLAGRAAVLVIRGGDVNAWSGIGFTDGEGLRGWRCSAADSPALARLVADERPVAFKSGQDPVFDGWLEGETSANDALMVPVCLRGQLMGCVYVDDSGGGPWDPDAIQGMVAVACWMIDTLHARQVVPTPMLAEVLLLEEELPEVDVVEEEQVVFGVPAFEPEVEADSAAEALVEDEEPSAVEVVDEVPHVSEQEAEFEPEDLEVAEPDAVAEDEEEAIEQAQEEVEVDRPDDYDPSATMRVEAMPEVEEEPIPVHEQETLIEESPVPEPVPVGEAPDEEAVVPAQPVTPPPPLEQEVIQEAPESGLSPEEEAQHEEARRFARLLISEIKLYNEEEVERGRLAKDIYPRLREDIDRSREMYEKRISEDVRQVTDYFDQELVRILAEDDPDALGM
jgi:hypothetical protein